MSVEKCEVCPTIAATDISEALFSCEEIDVAFLKSCLTKCAPTIIAQFRLVIWKVILTICPTLPSLNQFFETQRRRQVSDLNFALSILNVTNPELDAVTKVETTERVVFLLLLDQGLIPVSQEPLALSAIPKTATHYRDLVNILEENFIADEVDQFWLAKTIYSRLQLLARKIQRPSVRVEICGQIKDIIVDRGKYKNQKLIDDLVKLKLLDELPLESWILSCAAVIVPRDCLARILDFVLSDKEDIIFFLICEWMSQGASAISKATSASGAIESVTDYNREDASQIVDFSIVLFRKYQKHPTLNFNIIKS
jgi:hypothetical protein